MENEKQIEVLNTLIIINNDRIEGYETASEETKEDNLKSLFTNLQATSRHCKSELIFEVQKLGGMADEGTRLTGKFFRVWMDMKSALSGNDRETILESCEYGEGVAIDTYEDALKDNMEDLSTDQKVMLTAHKLLIQTDRATINGLLSKLK